MEERWMMLLHHWFEPKIGETARLYPPVIYHKNQEIKNNYIQRKVS